MWGHDEPFNCVACYLSFNNEEDYHHHLTTAEHLETQKEYDRYVETMPCSKFPGDKGDQPPPSKEPQIPLTRWSKQKTERKERSSGSDDGFWCWACRTDAFERCSCSSKWYDDWKDRSSGSW